MEGKLVTDKVSYRGLRVPRNGMVTSTADITMWLSRITVQIKFQVFVKTKMKGLQTAGVNQSLGVGGEGRKEGGEGWRRENGRGQGVLAIGTNFGIH